MRLNRICPLLILYFLCMGWLSSCKKWEDRVAVTNPALHNNLFQLIMSDSSLTQFGAMLSKTGYDKVLEGARTYTVWAPRNGALQRIDQTVTGDPVKLRQFVANHISYQSYLTTAVTEPLRVQMLNGKYTVVSSTRFDSAHVVVADRYAANGILQVIDSAVYALPNIWEFVNSTSTGYAQNAFLLTLNYQGFDSTKATLDSINPNTGKPVYVPGTGVVNLNHFTDSYAVNDEDSVYTYFIIRDANLDTAVNGQLRFFATGSTDSTNGLAAFNVVKDLAVSGQVNYSQLPDSLVLVSKYNVRVPIVKSAITEIHRVSNGVIYVLDHIAIPVGDENPPILIQGESRGIYSKDPGTALSVRLLQNPLTGLSFEDVYVFNVGGSFTIQYLVKNVYSTRFHVYWVAVNNLQTTAFSQRIAMDSSITTFPYVSVPVVTSPSNYAETYLGDYTTTRFNSHYVYLINTNSATSGVNTLDLDYVKLVPF